MVVLKDVKFVEDNKGVLAPQVTVTGVLATAS